MITPEEMREMAERMDDMMECWLDGGCMSEADNCKEAAAMLRSIAAEREAEAESKAQEEFNAGMAFEEYGGQAEGACLYGLYAENRQFASQEPPRRNERGGWDYSLHFVPHCEV